MKRRILTPAVIAVALLLVANAVWADSNWAGTFWETDPSQLPGITGTWEGTLYTTSALPTRFLGTWRTDESRGTCGGIAVLSSATGDYCILKGWSEEHGDTLYDCWKGCFNENTGLASGAWETELHYGKWEGRMLD